MAYDYPDVVLRAAPRARSRAPAADARRARRGGRALLRDAQAPADRRRRRRALRPRRAARCARSPTRTACRWPRRRPARARSPGTIRCSTGAIGVTGSPAANALASDADVRARGRHAPAGLHHRLALAVRAGARSSTSTSTRSTRCKWRGVALVGRRARRARRADARARRLARRARRGPTARTRGASAWRDDVARAAPAQRDGALPYDGDVIGAVQRSAADSAATRHRRVRRRHAAGRAAQALAHGGARRLSHRIRLLVHGLRDRRRPRRRRWRSRSAR